MDKMTNIILIINKKQKILGQSIILGIVETNETIPKKIKEEFMFLTKKLFFFNDIIIKKLR